MNDDPRFSFGAMVTTMLWLLTGVLVLASWTAFLLGASGFACLLVAESACVVSAIAATAQIRGYAARVCRLVRVSSGLERPDAEIRPLQPSLR